MMLHNMETMKKFKDTVFGITGISDVYLFFERMASSLSKPSDRPYHSFVYKIKGKSEYFVGENTYELSAGEVIYLPKGCVYTVDATENGESYIINFDFAADYGIDPFVIALDDEKRCEALLSKMVRSRANCEAWHANETVACLYGFITMIQRRARSMLVTQETIDFCHRAEKFIAQNFSRRALTVSDVAKAVGVEAGRLRAGFSDMCGMTPKEYILHLRVIKAKKLLINSDAPISNVAEHLGFADSTYFSRFFNERTGFYPTEYRNKFKIQ